MKITELVIRVFYSLLKISVNIAEKKRLSADEFLSYLKAHQLGTTGTARQARDAETALDELKD